MSQLTLQQILDLACRHHQAGRLAEAEKGYREILAQLPGNIDVLRNLGALTHQMGRDDVSAEVLRRVIALNPNLPEVHNGLGNALKSLGQLDEAIAAFRRAIAIKPSFFQAHNNLGIALAGKGQFDQASAAFSTAITLRPDFLDARINLGNALSETGRHDLAIAVLRQTIALSPALALAHFSLGTAMKNNGQLQEAIAAYHRALALDTNLAEAHFNLGIAFEGSGQPDQAIAALRKAISLRPADAQAYSELGNMFYHAGRVEDSIIAYRQAIALKSNEPQYHWNLSLALLACGDFEEGWEEFEWRLLFASKGLSRNFAEKQWDGSDPDGKTILLHTEGGFGDALQFVRFVPMLQGRRARFILECQPSLVSLMRCITGIDRIVARGEPLPKFDLHIPLQSLPRIFGTRLNNIPTQMPYLAAPSERMAKWATCIPRDGLLNVGLVWAGSVDDRVKRSRTLEIFEPLAGVACVRFFSLQKGSESNQTPPDGMTLIDHTAELHDFADTAALVQHLHLVITVDTSVAHLAGALGRPVWVLIPSTSDFRWLLNRQDSPWYPTMRLFRQTSAETWPDVISRVVDALATLRGI